MFPDYEQAPASYTVIEVRDPAEMDEASRVSRRLPGRNATHRYSLRNPAPSRLGKGTLLTRMAMRRAGDLQISHAADRFGTAIDIVGEGMPAYCFGFIRAGRMALSRPGTGTFGGDGWAEAGVGHGPIHGGQSGTQLLTLDGTARTNLWLATSRFEAALGACLREAVREPLIFVPTIDWTVGAGAGLRRLVAHAEAEFADPGGLATNPAALAAFIDLFVHTALRVLPHNYAERLARPDHPAPVHLRRAETYLAAHADAPLRLEDVAADAGCSVRALQRAFRQFRGTTPHAAIHATRLDQVRAEIALGNAPVLAIARRYGFTKPARFTAAYAKRFGAAPPGLPDSVAKASGSVEGSQGTTASTSRSDGIVQ